MPLLDAALAFALTMLVIAAVVTQLVNLLKMTPKVRRAGLQDMLKQYFSKELQPAVTRGLERLEKDVSSEIASGLADTADNFTDALKFDRKELAELTEVTTEEFAERLKRSDLGKTLLTELGDKAQDVFDELEKRYDSVGKKFTESFRKQSRNWATGVALVLAVVLNVDSIHIANSYIRDSGMRQGVIEQRDAFIGNYDALMDSLARDENKDSVTREELEQTFKDSREQLDVLMSVGFPIGWSYFPHCYFKDSGSNDFKQRHNLGGWVMWTVGILLTGGLARLGAPFWYDTVMGITNVIERTRGGKKLSKK